MRLRLTWCDARRRKPLIVPGRLQRTVRWTSRPAARLRPALLRRHHRAPL